VLVAVNSEKQTLFTLEERLASSRGVPPHNPRVEVDTFEACCPVYALS